MVGYKNRKEKTAKIKALLSIYNIKKYCIVLIGESLLRCER